MDQSKRGKVAGTSTVAATNDTPQHLPPCLKLLVECWEQILDYLSLGEINKLGGTCKMLNQLVGHYFNTYLPDLAYQLERNNVLGGFPKPFLVQPHFYQFIDKLKIGSSSDDGYILDADTFPSLKTLHWRCIPLTEVRFGYAQSALKNIENIKIFHCETANNTFDQLAIRSPNLKHLNLISRMGEQFTDLLSQYYPQLEHIQLKKYGGNMQTDNLKVFLEKHLKLKRFSTTFDFQWANRDSLKETNVKLETLRVDFDRTNIPSGEIVDFFKVLYDRGFYKRLFVFAWEMDTNVVNALYELPALEKLHVTRYSNIDLSRLIHLNELVCISRGTDLEKAARNLVHLERLFMRDATIDELLPFARHSKRLKELRLDGNWQLGYAAIDLSTFNEERKKLAGACPISIGVREELYIPTKWSTKNLDLKQVKIVRCDAFGFEFPNEPL